MLAILCLLGCTSGEATVDRDDPQPPVVNDGRVAVDLALSVSATNGNTRIASSDVVNPPSFEIEGLSVLPFVIPFGQDSIRKADIPVMEALTGFISSGKPRTVRSIRIRHSAVLIVFKRRGVFRPNLGTAVSTIQFIVKSTENGDRNQFNIAGIGKYSTKGACSIPKTVY